MSTGLYQDHEIVERFVTSPSVQTITQRFVAPYDADVLGCLLWLGTAPGATNGVAVNVSVSPTSQIGGSGTTVSAYNLWTTANQPSILGTATNNMTVSQVATVKNQPYALNYPLPGPSGTSGYVTAQSTLQTTETPVTAPPNQYNVGINPLYGSVAPDNTYTDYNGYTLVPASKLHAGDILTFSIIAAGASVSVGSAANLNIQLVMSKQ